MRLPYVNDLNLVLVMHYTHSLHFCTPSWKFWKALAQEASQQKPKWRWKVETRNSESKPPWIQMKVGSGEWEVGRNKSTATTKPARGQSLLWILVFCSPNQTSLIGRHLNWFNRGAHMLGLRLVSAVLTSYASISLWRIWTAHGDNIAFAHTFSWSACHT